MEEGILASTRINHLVVGPSKAEHPVHLVNPVCLFPFRFFCLLKADGDGNRWKRLVEPSRWRNPQIKQGVNERQDGFPARPRGAISGKICVLPVDNLVSDVTMQSSARGTASGGSDGPSRGRRVL